MITQNNPPFTIIFLFVGQLTASCLKPKHLKHFLLDILVGDSRVECLSLETLFCEVVSLEKLEEKNLV